MSRLIEPVEHVAQAIVRLFSTDGTSYRVHRVDPDDDQISVVVEAVTRDEMVLVTVATVRGAFQ